MKFIFILLLVPFANGYDEDDDEIIFPEPKFQGAELELIFLDEIDGCTFRENSNKTIICLGNNCTSFPSSINTTDVLETFILKIRNTRIQEIRKNSFLQFFHLRYLRIEFNFELTKLEPGCFHGMNLLTNLSISGNSNLNSLEVNTFEGLTNLQELYMTKNGFTHLSAITMTLSPTYVPSLVELCLNENCFEEVYKKDFIPMTGSQLEELQMVQCQIEYIQNTSLNPLKKLRSLRLGQNVFNSSVITALIKEANKEKIPLESLDMYNPGFRRTLPMSFLEVVAKSNITHLNLARSNLDNLNEYSFPKMPNLQVLNLGESLLLDIAPKTFNNLPNLQTLLLSGNRFPSVPLGVLLNNLKKLDLSSNSGNPLTRTYFRLDDYVFQDMTNLYALQLSNNLISEITNATFYGLENLKYLGLKNATFFGIAEGAFRSLNRLQYLNLENNPIITYFNASVFYGLKELRTLLLGGCEIDSAYIFPNSFIHLPNLTYLGLQRNDLFSFSSSLFPPLINLKSLDLSYNRLVSWNERIFNNPKLSALDLSQNKLKILTEVMMDDFQKLDTIDLEGNPFTCDCSLYPISKLSQADNFTVQCNKNLDYNAKCVNPDEWVKWSIFDYIDHLKSIPEECDMPTVISLKLTIGLSLIFLVLIVAVCILCYIYRLHVRYWIFLIRMTLKRHIKYRKKKLNSLAKYTEYKYDAFVSYSNEDQDFVTNLVTMLENYEPFLKLCVYERDFQIGTAISESVFQSVATSKKTLLIISNSFVKSQWCRWEAKLAEFHNLFFQDGDLQRPHGTLLLIRLGVISKENLSPTLKYLLRTRIYLEWDSEPEKQKIFWEKLRKKLTNGGTLESCTILSET